MKMRLRTNKFNENLKYPEDFVNKIICGDCLELIKSIPDNSIDVVMTDPPYGLNKNGVRNDSDLSLFYNIMPECDRVLKNNSFFITFFSTKFLPQLFKNNKFNYFWQIVLYCPEGMVNSPIGYTNSLIENSLGLKLKKNIAKLLLKE